MMRLRKLSEDHSFIGDHGSLESLYVLQSQQWHLTEILPI